MKYNFIAFIAILILVGFYTVISDKFSKPEQLKESLETKNNVLLNAPNFTWQDLSGKKFQLSDIQDKVIVINFWATWCPPCVIEFPQMINLAHLKNDKAVFIFLSVDDDKNAIERFLKKYAKALPMDNVYIGWDKNKDISLSLFGTKKYPETYILTPSKKIYEKIIGADIVWDDDIMQQKIDSVYTIKN